MKHTNLKYIVAIAMLTIGLTSCSSDDDEGEVVTPVDFSGTFSQEDQMGRPAISTALVDGPLKDEFNLVIPSEQGAIFQQAFLDRAVALHAAFGVEYENNILGLDANTLTTILASDVLQVAPGAPTSYFDGTNVLTGRNLTDDVVDISLTLIFGGENGDRFNGQDIDNDGTADLPILVSDGVSASGETPSSTFPYLEVPHSR